MSFVCFMLRPHNCIYKTGLLDNTRSNEDNQSCCQMQAHFSLELCCAGFFFGVQEAATVFSGSSKKN